MFLIITELQSKHQLIHPSASSLYNSNTTLENRWDNKVTLRIFHTCTWKLIQTEGNLYIEFMIFSLAIGKRSFFLSLITTLLVW